MVDTNSKYILHEFTMDGVEFMRHVLEQVPERPDLEAYCAEMIDLWKQTPEGKWCVEKATDLEYRAVGIDPITFGHRFLITGYLSGKYATFWDLKRDQHAIV